MSRRVRTAFFLLSAAALAWTFFLSYGRLAPAGAVESRYGDIVNALTVTELHVTDAVTTVTFNMRGFDTLGEEFILFMSVVGILLLMRRQDDEPDTDHSDKLAERPVLPASDLTRVTALLLLAPTFLFGLYIVTHGQVSPGGGFQGGVILASALLLLYLCAEYKHFRQVAPQSLVERLEAFGAAAYILIGVAGVAAGGLFLQNFLSPGETGAITSGGITPLISLGVGLEVAGGILLAIFAYLQELVEEKEQ